MTPRQDLRCALRSLRSNAGYSAVSLLTVALVVGAGAAVLAVVSATFIRPLPFKDADRLVWIYGQPPGTSGVAERNPIHSPEFVRFREDATLAQGVAGISFQTRAMLVGGAADNVSTGLVSANYFDVLGISLAAGRMFTDRDDIDNAKVAVASDAFWRTRLGARGDAIGQSVIIDGETYRITGILPPLAGNGFVTADLWTPLNIHAGNLRLPTATIVSSVGRLAPGATASGLSAQIGQLMQDVGHERVATLGGWGSGAMPMREALFGQTRPVLTLLSAAIAVLALIACANLANVTIAGAIGRRHEMTLRAALGASRADVVRLLALEQLVVAGAGGALGLLVSQWALPAILALDRNAAAGLGPVTVDWRVAGGAMLLTTIVSVISGVLPVVAATRGDLARDLAQGGRRLTGSRRQRRTRGWLVGAESLLASVLLAASALLLSAFNRTAAEEPGYDPHHVLGTRVQLPAASYPSAEARARFVREMVATVRALPGVVSAGVTDIGFQLGSGYNTQLRIDGRPSPDGRPYTTQFRRIGPGYFETMKIAVVRGRSFSDADDLNGQQVAIVSQSFADKFWPGEDPLGRRVVRAPDPTHPLTVVGVVANVRDTGLGLPPAPTIYIAHAQNNSAAAPVSLVVRTAGDPGEMIRTVTSAVHKLDPTLPLTRTTTMDAFLSASLGPDRFRSVLLVTFAAVGMALAAVGIFGVTSRGVVERTRELGVRLALGSGRGELWLLVVRQAMTSVLVGLACSVPAAIVSIRLIAHWLPNVTGGDAVAALPAAVVLSVAAFLAAAIPAFRAARVDPTVTLAE